MDKLPLGKVLKLVRFIPFAVCAEFVQQLEGRGAFLVSDSHFISPLLLLCLVHHHVVGR